MNEKLIEEARDPKLPYERRYDIRQELADALEAAVKAHAPTAHEVTTDEREALAKAIHYLRGAYRIRTPEKRDEGIPGAIRVLERLTAGFRRTEVPEPSAEHDCNWGCGVDKYGHDYHAEPQGEPSPIPFYDEKMRELAEVRAQGEPSDAQVDAAWGVIGRGWFSRDVVRAALRAANEAR